MIEADIEFVLDGAALQQLMTSPSGPVAKHLGRIGVQVEGRAKELASGVLVNVDTGRYRSSITHRMFRRGNQLGVAVGSGVHYGLWLEVGTRHIAPRRVI